MKALLSLLVIPLLLVATASADWVIESKIESAAVNSATTTKIKGDKMRIDIPDSPAGSVSTIVDNASGESINLIHTQKIAMKVNAAESKQAVDAVKKQLGVDGGASGSLQPTGQKEKVGDYDCEIYTWTSGPMSARVWVASNHPHADALKAMEKQSRSGILGSAQSGPDTSSVPGAAIKTEMSVQGQKITTTIVSVKEQALDASDFEVPAGYQTVALPGGLLGK